MPPPPPAPLSELQVRLVAPRVWQPQVADAFAMLAPHGPAAARLAETVLWTLHNRHVGITPWLVSQLVPLLLDPRTSARGGASGGERGWQVVLRRLVQEITPPARDGPRAGQYHGGIALGASGTYTVLKVLTPLILAACAEIGQNCLFAADDAGTSVSPEAYTRYMQELATAILDRASKVPAPDPETGELPRDPFWFEPAATLAGLVRRGTDGSGSRALPSSDPVELGLLLRLRPRLTDSAWARRRQLPTPTAPTGGQRRREAGYVGIHLTHRDEDLPAMLLSEMMMPRAIRLDRLLNTGYYALERKPRRQRVRDVLVVGMLPPSLAGRAGGDLVKASWVDFALRLSTLLRQHQLLKSELRWLEGDAFERFRACTFGLEDIPLSDAADDPVQLSQGRREGLLNAMRWLPGYVDERAHFQGDTPMPPRGASVDERGQLQGDSPLPHTGISATRRGGAAEMMSAKPVFAPRSGGTGGEGHPGIPDPDDILLESTGRSLVPEWVVQCWRAQQPRGGHASYTVRGSGRATHQRNGRRPHPGAPADAAPVESFAYVHVMLFLPAAMRPRDGLGLDSARTVIRELRARLGMGARADRQVSVTWTPDDLSDAGGWTVDTRRRVGVRLADEDAPPDTLDEHELAGRLVTTWLTGVTEDLSGG
ncbi:MAG: hypothetical protein IT306_06745 [Chloroflexi bacterium]|nr:hypothetical protein [Chloroflexota bacterium]